jgi:hypothetical protein
MTDTPETWDDYFGALAAEWMRRQQSGGWPLVRRVKVKDFMEGQCHPNAERYAAAHDGEVVHGYLFMHPQGWDAVQIFPHSIVQMPDGHLHDPTPNELPPEALPFLKHQRDDVAFETVARAFPVYPVKIRS